LNTYRSQISRVRRVVVKVGTSQLADPRHGVKEAMLRKLAAEVHGLRRGGRQVVIVTSGAIGLGMHQLKLKERPRGIPEKQATAAVGQVLLMHLYRQAFARHGMVAAQVLLTRQDLKDKQRTANARHTLETLLGMGTVPVINENDTVAVDEIGKRFGDNDSLAAHVTALARAGLLVILTDVDGLYDGHPGLARASRLVPLVSRITAGLKRHAGGAVSRLGTGGMLTKLNAARIVTAAGKWMIIANGSKKGILASLLAGREEGTLFLPVGRGTSRKRAS
jgi:glutamate 5-kinase